MNATNEPTLQELLDVAKRLFGQKKINWRFMREASAMPLSDLAAMSVGLTAAFVESVIEETTPSPETPINELVEMLAYQDADVIEARHRMAISFIRLSVRDGLHPAIGEVDGFNTPVSVSEFATFAQSMGWELPPEFPRPLASPVSIQPAATPGAPESDEATEEAAPSADHDATLSALFDPVGVEQLRAMFPDEGWKGYVERADRNGLKEAAKEGRAIFNPYRAAVWWLKKAAPKGWDWDRCLRKLANNLPARSLDSKVILTGYDD